MIKKLHLKEAEDDYVKIGNMILPKNASSYGYNSYDSIARDAKRNYDAEKEAECQEEEKRRRREKGAPLYNKFVEIMNSGSSFDEKLNDIDELLIPASGKADTMAGEIMRAVQRLLYRDWNDGDLFYSDYGLETCASSASFLMDYTDTHIKDILLDAMRDGLEGDAYTKMLNSVAKRAMFYLKSNAELFGEPVEEDSRNYEGNFWDDIMEAGHSYEFEINSSYFEEQGIDYYTIESFIQDIASNYSDATVEHPYRDYYTISNLTKEDYNDLERNYGSWEEEFISENVVEEEEDWEDDDYDEDEN